ncbi:unnamed protein product [Allacma fusca]|uniref:Zinc transporter ZIP1 n=1 Tax=Allacma fusca TaxID=39272 RepID=A0A8J2JVG7_9HEXA|nr:unnamed protein product [Allacma fusca]
MKSPSEQDRFLSNNGCFKFYGYNEDKDLREKTLFTDRMDLSWEKWLVMAALAVISIILGMIPYVMFNSKKSCLPALSAKSSGSLAFNLTLTVLSCFGGGVLLSTALVHMLPEARYELAQIPTVISHFDSHFPHAEILTLVGFGLIYLVEEIAHLIIGQDGHEHHPVVRHNSSVHSVTFEDRKVFKKPKGSPTSNHEDGVDNGGVTRAMRSILALIALSFHAIMEGIAVGIQENESLWFMFGAVASHKFVISFCMGIELYATRAKLSTYVGSVTFFGIISSVGILIGTFISSDDSNTLAIAIIKALSTGTVHGYDFVRCFLRDIEPRAKQEGLFKV